MKNVLRVHRLVRQVDRRNLPNPLSSAHPANILIAVCSVAGEARRSHTIFHHNEIANWVGVMFQKAVKRSSKQIWSAATRHHHCDVGDRVGVVALGRSECSIGTIWPLSLASEQG